MESSEFKDVLRERIEGLIKARLAEVEAAVSTARSEVSDLMGRLSHEVSPSSVDYAENPILDQLSREIHAQVGQAAAESSRLSGDLALLRDSVVDVDSQQTQSDVLTVLVDRASSFAPRVILFVVKGQDAIAWAARGFEDEIGDGSVRGLSVTVESDTILHSVVKNGSTFLGVPQDQPDNAVLLDRLGSVMPERIAGIPLRVRTKIAAILYADTYDTSVSSISIEALELLVHSAGIIVELASLRQRLAEVGPPFVPQPVVASASLPHQSFTSPYSTLSTPRPSFDVPSEREDEKEEVVAEPSHDAVAEEPGPSEPVAANAPSAEAEPEAAEADATSAVVPTIATDAALFVSTAEPAEAAPAGAVDETESPDTDELPPSEPSIEPLEPSTEAASESGAVTVLETEAASESSAVTVLEVESQPVEEGVDPPSSPETELEPEAGKEPDTGFVLSDPGQAEPTDETDAVPVDSPTVEPFADEPAPFTFSDTEPETPAPFSFEPQPWDTTQPAGSPVAPPQSLPDEEVPSEPPPFVFGPPADEPLAEPEVAEPAPFVFSTPEPEEAAPSASQSVNGHDESSVQAPADASGWTETRSERREPMLTWETRAKPPFPGELSEEEEKLHSDARRFARLLVSEIKLYNEHQVVEGRSNNDLYERLKDDIDRSRQMYEKRVAAVVAERFDYFFDELLNTLAQGDAAKLGVECPGPTV